MLTKEQKVLGTPRPWPIESLESLLGIHTNHLKAHKDTYE